MLAFLCLAHAATPVPFEGEGHAYSPVFSPDGKYIAFEVNRYTEDVELWVASLEGTESTGARLIPMPGGHAAWSRGRVMVEPNWHPVGVVVFSASNAGGDMRIYSHVPGLGAAGEMVTTEELQGNLTFPVVAPDGSQMVFVAESEGQGDLALRHTRTARLSFVKRTETAEMFPTFAADSKTLLYSRKNQETEDVYLLDPKGKEEVLVAGGDGDQTRPVFAGERIVFFDSYRDPESWDLVAVNGAGGERIRLAEDIRLPLRIRPAVSPDGRFAAFAPDSGRGRAKIVLIAVDGSRRVEIPSPFRAVGEPALARQGDRVLLAYTALPDDNADWRMLVVEDVTEVVSGEP